MPVENITRRKLSFQNREGEQLAGMLELPSGTPRAYALFAHCFTCSKNIAAATRISRALAAQGFAVLRFDFTGLGNSEGDFANTNFSSNVEDLLAAAEHLQQNYAPVELLIGHSLGGAAVLAAAGDLPQCKAVATIAAPADPTHVHHLFADSIDEIQQQGSATVELAGRRFKIKRHFLEDTRAQRLYEKIAGLRKALLVLHSPVDDTVSVDNASEIFQAAKHPKSFVSLDNADHLLTDSGDAGFVADVVAAWSARYLASAGVKDQDAFPVLPDHSLLVRETGDNLSNDIFTGRHHLIADEPVAAGGDDKGPDPYKYLLAALGSCTSMTLRMYARYKNLPLEKISVQLKHDRIHAEDCAECETETGKLDQISREIEIHGELTDEQRQRLLEIADKCPVHKTLSSEIHIVSELKN